MDQQSHVSKMRPSNNQPGTIRSLTKIDPATWSGERLAFLWEHLKTQEYAFDDVSILLGHNAFLIPLFNRDSEWYEIGDSGIAAMVGIIPKVNANFHYAVWDDISPRELFTLQRQLFDDTFTRWQLNRITAYIPSINKEAVRMATIAGLKYEGEFRKAFLKNGIYCNMFIYGILHSEFYAREVRN